MQPAMLWRKAEDSEDVLCGLCSQYCRIAPGHRGFCGVRENKGGELFTHVADRVAAINLDPVEKKPLYHFMPGTMTFSFGTMGCNVGCSFCQNFSLSQPPREGRPITGQKLTPEDMVRAALDNGAQSISYTYSEPTIFFELMLQTAKLAVEKGLKNIMVSNGYQSPACLDALAPYIHAANIDLKSFRDHFYREQCQARLKPVLQTLKHIKKLGWWLEVTTLLIPNLNDAPEELAEMTSFIKDELGAETPWHISRFHPSYRLTDRGPTPVETLERAYEIGKQTGLQYIYVGNVPGHNGNNTMCPAGCGPVIERRGFTLGKCSSACDVCGATIPGVGMETLSRGRN